MPQRYSLCCGFASVIFFAVLKSGPEMRRSGNSENVWRVKTYVSAFAARTGVLNAASSYTISRN